MIRNVRVYEHEKKNIKLMPCYEFIEMKPFTINIFGNKLIFADSAI